MSRRLGGHLVVFGTDGGLDVLTAKGFKNLILFAHVDVAEARHAEDGGGEVRVGGDGPAQRDGALIVEGVLATLEDHAVGECDEAGASGGEDRQLTEHVIDNALEDTTNGEVV